MERSGTLCLFFQQSFLSLLLLSELPGIFSLKDDDVTQSETGLEKGRLFSIQVNDDLTLNLLPFLLLLKVAFILGILLKESLVSSMEDYMAGYGWDDTSSYVSPSSYYVDANRVFDQEHHPQDFSYVGTASIDNEKPSFLGNSVSSV